MQETASSDSDITQTGKCAHKADDIPKEENDTSDEDNCSKDFHGSRGIATAVPASSRTLNARAPPVMAGVDL